MTSGCVSNRIMRNIDEQFQRKTMNIFFTSKEIYSFHKLFSIDWHISSINRFHAVFFLEFPKKKYFIAGNFVHLYKYYVRSANYRRCVNIGMVNIHYGIYSTIVMHKRTQNCGKWKRHFFHRLQIAFQYFNQFKIGVSMISIDLFNIVY